MSAVLPVAQVPMRTGPAARFGLGSLPQIAAVLALMLAGVLAAATVNGYYVFVLANVALLAIVGIGLNVLQGLTGQVSFGHVGFYAIGAYTVHNAKISWADDKWEYGAFGKNIFDEDYTTMRLPVQGVAVTGQYAAGAWFGVYAKVSY